MRMDDASLDDFLSDESGEAQAEDDTGETEAPAVEPAVATAQWHAQDTTCEECGRAVSRLWNDEGRFRCRDCKEW